MKSRRRSPQLALPFAQTGPAPKSNVWNDPSAFDPPDFDLDLAVSEALPTRPSRVATPRSARRPAAPERAHRLTSDLRVLLGSQLKLHVHDNRSTMVSFRRDDDVLHLRVHHMFLAAGPEVVRALADYARVRSARAGRVLDHFVRLNREAIKQPGPDELLAKPLRTAGDVYDLQELYDELNVLYFGGRVDARIGWGRGSPLRRRRSIRMGAYYHDTRTILIHPALDRGEVPRYFVELVVYHEMLHQAVPQQRESSGRRCIHSPEFRARERDFHEFERARNWERRNLGLLLRPQRQRR